MGFVERRRAFEARLRRSIGWDESPIESPAPADDFAEEHRVERLMDRCIRVIEAWISAWLFATIRRAV